MKDTTRKKLLDSTVVQTSTRLYRRYEKYYAILSFVAGFVWDSITLTRIDRLSDQLILLAYLVLIGVFIFLSHLTDKAPEDAPGFLFRYKHWFPVGIQFLFGGLFSSYVVYYFQSAAFSKDLVFVALLFILLIANELLDKHLTNLKLELLLYFLSLFAFFTFFLPVVFKVMNVWLFILSGLLSLAVSGGLLYLLNRQDQTFRPDMKHVAPILIAYLLMNGLYFFNWIPPVPLSVKKSMICHHVHKEQNAYVLEYEPSRWYVFWQSYNSEFHRTKNDTLFCFVSVFAPTRLKEKIYHHWQYYEPHSGKWLTADRLGYRITGGRDGGYRGFTYKTHIKPGEWRVDVETSERKILGRIHFRVSEGKAERIKRKRTVF